MLDSFAKVPHQRCRRANHPRADRPCRLLLPSPSRSKLQVYVSDVGRGLSSRRYADSNVECHSTHVGITITHQHKYSCRASLRTRCFRFGARDCVYNVPSPPLLAFLEVVHCRELSVVLVMMDLPLASYPQTNQQISSVGKLLDSLKNT